MDNFDSMVTLKKGKKSIVIYIKIEDWANIPDLSWIQDVEVFEEEQENKEK